MRRAHSLSLAIAGLLAVSATTGSAATVASAGGDLSVGGSWRTASVAKTDPAGTNVLGQQGYDVLGNNNGTNNPPDNYGTSFKSEPAYITIDGLNSQYPGNASYASIDNPVTTPGGSPSTIVSGTTNPFPGTNVSAESFSFIINSSAPVPASFQVAVLIDNLDIAAFNSNSIHVSQYGGPTNTNSIATVDTTPAAYNDRAPDLLYFTIAGAQVGDHFYVGGTGGPNGAQTTGLVAFDSVPEPASLGILGFGGLGLLARRRRA